jgi:hypothetical protein
MKPNSIGIDAQGVFCVEAPDKLSYRNLQFYLKVKEYQEALEQAMKDRKYFKPETYLLEEGNTSLFFKDLKRGMFIKRGELYPIPEGFEVRIERTNMPCDGKNCKLVALLVSKQEPENGKKVSEIMGYNNQPTSIEEAADLLNLSSKLWGIDKLEKGLEQD